MLARNFRPLVYSATISPKLVALDGHLLSGLDLVVELDQMLDDPDLDHQDRERTIADKTRVLARASNGPVTRRDA